MATKTACSLSPRERAGVRRSVRKHHLPLAALLLLPACTVGPDYAAPGLFAPSSWFAIRPPSPHSLEASMPAAEPVDPEWWRSFNDPVLTGLVRRAADGNLLGQPPTALQAELSTPSGISGVSPRVLAPRARLAEQVAQSRRALGLASPATAKACPTSWRF